MTIDVLKFLSLFILLVLATISVAVSFQFTELWRRSPKDIEAMYKYGLLALFLLFDSGVSDL